MSDELAFAECTTVPAASAQQAQQAQAVRFGAEGGFKESFMADVSVTRETLVRSQQVEGPGRLTRAASRQALARGSGTVAV